MGSRRIIGLALGEKSIIAVEAAHRGKSLEVVSAAEFKFSNELSWKSPAALGEALAQFLQERKMNAPVVAGLPANWLMTLKTTTPPAPRDMMPAVLRMSVERAISVPPEHMVFDCPSTPAPGQAGEAYVVGTTRERLDAVLSALNAGKLTAKAVTSLTAPLAIVHDGLLVNQTNDAIEIALAKQGVLHAISHVLPGDPSAASALSLEIAGAAGGVQLASVTLNSVAADNGMVESACKAAGMAVAGIQLDRLPNLDAVAKDSGLSPQLLAPSAALALAGLEPQKLAFDLLHTRLQDQKRFIWKRQATWAAAIGAVIVISLGAVLYDQHRTARMNADLQSKISEIQPQATDAASVVKTITMASEWFDKRPPYLDCMKDVTLAFPLDSRIWATGLVVNTDMRGVLSGKATNDSLVFSLFDALQKSKPIKEVKMMYLRETRAAGEEKAFAISFLYKGAGT